VGVIFADGTGITPGTEECKCGHECEFPCWQRLGIAPPCGACGCEIDTGYTPPGRKIGLWHFQTNAWGGLWITWMRGEDYRSWWCLTLWKPCRLRIERGN
jgi:hypothetical protein